MDSLVCVAPGELKLEKRPLPQPAAGQVLVRPRRIGICGTDYHIYEGKHPFLQYPRVMGHEMAVEVVEAPGSSSLRTGEICVVNPYLSCGTCIACRRGKPNCCTRISVLGVHQDGGMQDLIAIPENNLISAPGLSLEACATVEFLAIGAHAVRRAAISPGDMVLVIGAGPIGLGAALFAKIAGAKVAILDRDSLRAQITSNILGTDSIPFNESLDQTIAGQTDGNGFDVVFDATGNQASMQRGFDFVAAGGRYVLVSVVKDQITFSDPDFHRRELTLYGSRNATDQDFSTVIAALRSGNVPLDKIITHRTSLAEAAHNLPKWAHEKSGLIKALIAIDG
jgi:2-desacetyl-2-hydroxyethyl bacteriochlorophyllide A dehydrogenase